EPAVVNPDCIVAESHRYFVYSRIDGNRTGAFIRRLHMFYDLQVFIVHYKNRAVARRNDDLIMIAFYIENRRGGEVQSPRLCLCVGIDGVDSKEILPDDQGVVLFKIMDGVNRGGGMRDQSSCVRTVEVPHRHHAVAPGRVEYVFFRRTFQGIDAVVMARQGIYFFYYRFNHLQTV